MAHLSEAIRYTRDSGNTNTVTTNYLAGYSAGTLVAVAVNAPVGTAWTAASVTDSAGNTYTRVGSLVNAAPANYQLATFYCLLANAVTTGTTLTATVTGANPAKWTILGHAFDEATAFDVTGSATGSSGTPNSGNVTPTQASQTVIGVSAFTNSNPGTLTFSPAAGWTASALATASPASAARSLVMAWTDTNSIAGRAFSGTVNPSQGWAAAVLAFTKTATNQAPTVTLSASADPAESLSAVTLSAAASDPDGTVASYSFTQLSGPTVTLSGTGATRTFEAPAPKPVDGDQTLSFRVEVTDNDGATAQDDVSLVVPVHCQWWFDGATMKPRVPQIIA